MNDRFLGRGRREWTDRVPVWFMRQAGRYMEEARAVRAKHSTLEVCKTPELAARVTLQPIERFPLDAAIIFADILPPLEPMGLRITFEEGEGPVIHNPVRTRADVDALRLVEGEELQFVSEAIRLARRSLDGRVPLIGFAGAPFTLASYAIEGGASRSFARTKGFMHGEPAAWHALLDRLAELVGRYLAAQAGAGARALQLFDSWVGCLSPADYREYVLPHSRRALELAGAAGVPVIHFGTDTATFLEDFAAAGGDVIGVDWRIPPDGGWRRIGARARHGDVGPAALLAPSAALAERGRGGPARAGRRAGHIFHLRPRVLPATPVEAAHT